MSPAPAALYHALRPGDGPVALLLLHPLGADLRFWDAFVAAWDRPEPVVACDLRGVGGSPGPGRPVGFAEHVADLEDLRLRLGFDRLVPVGCAIGAMVAACYAAAHPDRAAALVLANPGVRTVPAARAVIADRVALVRDGGMRAILPGAVDRAFAAQPRDARHARYLAMFGAQSAEAYALAALAVLDADVSSELARVECPTLVVAGAHDALFPSDQAREVQALVRGSRLEIDPDAAHFVPYQNPAGFRDRVTAFLGAVTGAGKDPAMRSAS